MLKAIGYARISKDDDLKGRGVERQREDIEAACERKGWALSEVIAENDISASRYSRKKRTEYRRLIDLIAAGTVDRAVVYNLDRLLRQPRELEDLIDLCERLSGFELHTVTGEIDLRTAQGRMIARNMASVAAMESDNLSQRLRRANDQAASKGEPHGPRPFGYGKDRLTIREREADLIRQAADDVLAGTSLNAVARRWQGAGVKPPQRASEWYPESIKAILTGPRIAGLRQHRGEIVGPGAWPAIIDRDTHERLKTHLTTPRPRRASRRTAFTGLIVGANGVPLDRDVVNGRPTYRGHKRPGREAAQVSIAAEPLERLIVATMFEAIEAGRLGQHAGEQASRREAVPDIGQIEEDLRGLAEDFGNGRISRGEWLAARQPLEDRLTAARAELDRVAGADVAADLTADLGARWDEIPVGRQRQILSTVFERVVIHPATQRGGPQPLVPNIGRIDVSRVEPVWRL